MACAQFNKGQCTFLEGPLKRRNRKSTDPKAKRGRKKAADTSLALTPELDNSLDGGEYGAGSSLHGATITPLIGSMQPQHDSSFPLSGQASYHDIAHGLQHSDAALQPLAGPGVGAGAGAGSLVNGTSHSWLAESPYGRDVRYQDGLTASSWQQHLQHSQQHQQLLLLLLLLPASSRSNPYAPDVYLRQLTLSSLSTLSNTSFWLEALPGYETLLNMLNDYGDAVGKRLTASLYPALSALLQLQYTQQLLLQIPTSDGFQGLMGWTYGDYMNGLGSGVSEALTLQGSFAGPGATLSPTSHMFGSGEPVGESLA